MSAVVAQLISFSPLNKLRKVMARATHAEADSTGVVVSILNRSGGSSTESLGKRKRDAQPASGPIGRPPKKSKITDVPNAPTSEAFVRPSSTVAQNLRQTRQISKLSSTTKLRNPESSTSTTPRRSKRVAAGTDMYAVPTTPESSSPATNRRASGKGNEYSLENSVFDSLPSSKKGAGTLVKPPSQNTRSKSKKSNAAEHQTSLSLSGDSVRVMRKPRPRPAVDDSIRDDPLQSADERRHPSRAPRKSRQRTLESGPLACESSADSSNALGYTSPEKASRTSDKLTSVTNRSAPAPDTGDSVVSSRTRHSRPNTGYHQSDDGEEEENEEVLGDRTEEDDAQREKTPGQVREAVERHCGPGPQSGAPQAMESDEREESATRAAADGQQSERPIRQGIFEEAAELYDCGEHWAAAWDAAKENQDRSDPETRTVRELVEGMRELQRTLRRTADVVPDQEQEDPLRGLDESEFEKIATAMGNLKKNRSRTGEREERLIRDIYFHAIPRAVELLRTVLAVRYRHHELTMAALEELTTVLKAVRRLCERVYHWKPRLHLGDLVKSRTNSDIKLSLRAIEDAYKDELSELRAVEYNARAKIREKLFAEKQKRLEEARRQKILANRQRMVDWAREHDMDGRQRREISRQHARDSHESSKSDLGVYDVDKSDSGRSTPLTSNEFLREGTEEIPGPTKRVWQVEETLALMLLLQKHRGLDRYERIQETISGIARDIRKLGPDRFRTMMDSEFFIIDLGNVGDVLDDLGNMDVADIQQQAKYLKASLAREMKHDIQATGDREKWTWISSV